VHLGLVAVQLMFASFSVVGKIALRQVPAMGLAAVRVSLASAVFLAVWALRFREPIARRELAELALYALFGIVANQLLFLGGLARTSATHAAVLGASIPVFTAAVAVGLGRERATARKLGGLGLALLGALALTGASGLDAGGGRALVGDLMILLNSLCYAVYLVISRHLLARLRPMTVVTFVYCLGTLGILPIGGAAFLRVGETLTPATWAAIAFIVAFPTVGAYLLNAMALRSAPASLVAIYIYLQPVIGALLAMAVLGERPGPLTLVAAALIFAGIWLVTLDARRGSAAA
jgi:drug/metabolite transporter (DMT)-like permease